MVHVRAYLCTLTAVFLLLPSALSAGPAADHNEAVRLNALGFDHYSAGKYQEALELFDASRLKDPGYAYSSYNYACTAGILIRMYPDQRSRLAPAAYEALAASVRLRSSYRDKMLTDPDLAALRDEYRFYRIAGFDPAASQDAVYLLQNLRWTAAADSDRSGLDFFSDGTVLLGKGDQAVSGTYRVMDGGRIVLEFSSASAALEEIEGIIGRNGLLVFSSPGMIFTSSRAGLHFPPY